MMGTNLRAFSRYRPRVLTLAAFVFTAALLVLSNATYQTEGFRTNANSLDGMYGGWPMIWYRLVLADPVGYSGGWQINAPRLTGNVAMWLAMLAAPTVACEWLLRRYRPRLRWSLRTMLIAVGLMASICAWFVVARNRADERDELIPSRRNLARLKRWGPRWLDPLCVDRFRRRLVGITIAGSEQYAEQRLDRLARLAETQLISLEIDHLTPRMIHALRDMPQLRTLSIDLYYGRDDDGVDQSISGECLAALGTLGQLEHLQLKYLTLAGDGLGALAGLAHLKTLSLNGVFAQAPPLLQCLPMLPQLEAIDIEGSYVCDGDLRSLAALPCLRSLRLAVPESEFDGFVRAQRALREAKPGLVIDNNAERLNGRVNWQNKWVEDESADRDRLQILFPWLRTSFWTVAPPEPAKTLPW